MFTCGVVIAPSVKNELAPISHRFDANWYKDRYLGISYREHSLSCPGPTDGEVVNRTVYGQLLHEHRALSLGPGDCNLALTEKRNDPNRCSADGGAKVRTSGHQGRLDAHGSPITTLVDARLRERRSRGTGERADAGDRRGRRGRLLADRSQVG
jgi:hypothetical protein